MPYCDNQGNKRKRIRISLKKIVKYTIRVQLNMHLQHHISNGTNKYYANRKHNVIKMPWYAGLQRHEYRRTPWAEPGVQGVRTPTFLYQSQIL